MIFKKLLIISLLLFTSLTLSAQTHTLSGKIFEKETEQPITGAKIILTGTNYRAISGLDGSYIIKNIPKGDYELTASFISYENYKQTIEISSDTEIKILLTSEVTEIEGVSIIANRSIDSEASARATEKNAMNVLNVISAKEIEVSPDITVANVVQRVSGVSLERNNNGDGQHAIVRGMDKRYNYTLVNGIKIPSPDPRNRYIPLDIFPSDLLDRLEVTKALTPNMEGDALGGVIDMKMKNAPNHFTVNANIGTGYSQMWLNNDYRSFDRSNTNKLSPRMDNGNDYIATIDDFQVNNVDFEDVRPALNQVYNLTIGNRFFNNKLGILVAGSYQNTFRGSESMFMDMFVNQEENTPYYTRVQVRQFSSQQIRTGVHAKLDYQFNKNHKLDLYMAAVNLDEFETRTRTDTILSIGRGQGPGTGRIEMRERSRQTYQGIYNATLQGTHKFGSKIKADWSAVASLATNDDPDMAELQWITAIVKDSDGNFVQDPIMYDTDYTRRWMNNTDQDYAGYANVYYSPKIFGKDLELSAGGMSRLKTRTSNFDEYLFRTIPIMQEWSGSPYDATWELFNTQGTPTDPLNYDVTENVMAGYGMFNLDLKKLKIMGGARIESTFFQWESQAPPQVEGRTGRIEYFDVLPSLHFKYLPNEKTNVRASYFSSISRPNFFEIIPYEINEENFRERGNPNLKRTKADNFDVRYERFSNRLDKIMVGAFYKNIQDPIERSLFIENQAIFLRSNNFGTATNWGVEFDYTKYVREFGIRFFYTYTNSEITTSKIVRFRDDQGNLTSREEDQTRPLQGQSAHVSNLSLLYKNQKSGTDIQLSTVYTGRRIIGVSPYLDNDIWQRGFVQMDFSFEQRITPGIVAYVKVNNLLNTPMQADIMLPNTFNPEQAPYIDSSKDVLVWEDYYFQTYLVGLKFSLNQYSKRDKKRNSKN
ncbi:TonB-dependent receptor [Brumimicrobium mesophilum]|uniref:TonB-dependent receptor n=1 Tax=Brumimicrobium mesophilum TaxID=392717 RepID=UPI000D1410CD|nr:TonB-dependent receptor [Brumimicrobium mesophilum]